MSNAGVPIELLDPGFQIQRKLGTGGSSEVWQATLGERTFALKIGSEAHRGALAREAERLVLCGSERMPLPVALGDLPTSMVTATGEQLTAGAPYLLLSYCPGLELGDVSTSDPRALAMAVARDVGEALSDLHTSGFAHGDVKLANVIVDTSSVPIRCALIDLGLADVAHAATPRGGTLRYLPPEIAAHSKESDARARDLWAFGLSLLEVLVPEARTSPAPRTLLERCPPPFRQVIAALLHENPGARPGAEWVRRQLGSESIEAGPLGLAASGPAPLEVARTRSRIRRSYLAARGAALQRVARGYAFQVNLESVAGQWLEQTCQVLRAVAQLRGNKPIANREIFESFDEAEQRRWLLRLIGATLVDFPPLPALTDSELVERLLQLAELGPPETFTHVGIARNPKQAEHAGHTGPANGTAESLLELVLKLGAEAPEEGVLERIEAFALRGEAPLSIVLALGNALKRRHALARALAVLRTSNSAEARVEEAYVLVRLGDTAAAHEALRDVLASDDASPEVRGSALALEARLQLSNGEPRRARELLADAAPTARVLEARASVELTAGELDAARATLERATSHPHSAEQRARIEALLANCAQQRGDSTQALERFRKAAEHAARAGALVEEATYLVGIAGTATNVGRLGEAIAAAERSASLFQVLGNPEAAARAVLSRASALACAGAAEAAHSAATLALQLARQSGDVRCQAFAHLVSSDVLPPNEAREHVQRAKDLLGSAKDSPRSDDRLRIAAREHRLGVLEQTAEWDRFSRHEAAADARLEWWGARARVAFERGTPHQEEISTELLALVQVEVGVSFRGPAFAHGAELAAQAGDGETARRLARAANDAQTRLREGLPPGLELGFGELAWTRLQRAPQVSHVSPEQLTDVETLIHGLGERAQLSTLLNRILDALVTWTSVERGLLLLTAPGGKLVPRAGRNLARKDLSGEQLKLSTSLARRAWETRECIVAVDAAGELPEVHQSVHSLKLRSVLAVPLLARGDVVGVAYLDDRMRRGAFGKQELAWVKLVGTLAAVAIAETRDQLLLRRAARKARRAEERVTRLLATREAELLVAERELGRTRDRATRYAYDDIVGTSEPIRRLLQLVDRVTPSDIPVLIRGESGSGKDLIARAIHYNGPRKRAPFVSENCSAIPETLLESTLFGHVKGAFTGAARHHAGLFEVAHRGTLFLDEIADMSLGMQAKLLRALESGEIRRVGSEKTITVDVRVLGATHKDLEQLVERGQFREDLYYRLNVITLRVPPLRERPEDIPLLVHHFLKKYAVDRPIEILPEVLEHLRAFEWPGNVRQLENEFRRALVLADAEIRLEHCSVGLAGSARTPASEGLNLRARLDTLETQLVERALRETSGNQTQAAKLLGVSRFGLQKMIRRLEIDAPERRASTTES